MGITYTGVMSLNSSDEAGYILDDAMNNGINITVEEIERDYREENGMRDDEDIPDDFWDFDYPEDCTYLLGDWEWDSKRKQYVIHKGCNGAGYAAVIQTLGGAYNAHVVWSETIVGVQSMCSPCCPNQADLDSGPGSIQAYTIPME